MTSRLDYCTQLYLGTNLQTLKNLQVVQTPPARLSSWRRWEYIPMVLCFRHWLSTDLNSSNVSILTINTLHRMDPCFHWMRQSLVTLNYALLWRSAVGSVSNKDEACKTQKTVVSEAGARAELTFAREESNSNTIPLSQQTAKFISWILINNRNKNIQTLVSQ